MRAPPCVRCGVELGEVGRDPLDLVERFGKPDSGPQAAEDLEPVVLARCGGVRGPREP